MIKIFIPDLPEFMPLVDAARTAPDCEVSAPINGYWQLRGNKSLRFERKALRLRPALWNSALTGGFLGKIVEYSRDTLVIENET